MPPDPTDEEIGNLVLDGATDQDICDLHDLTWDQMSNRFGKLITKARAQRRMELHRMQNKAADRGSASILSLLGKHELGQTTNKDAADDDWPEPQLDPKVG